MKLKCRKCGIVFTIPDAMPSDVTALNKAECGAGYGTPFHEVRGCIEWREILFTSVLVIEKIQKKLD